MGEPNQGPPGPNVLIMGDTGTGKTYSLRTLVDSGITPFVLFTEPGMESLGKACADLPAGSYHWQWIPPTVSDWSSLIKTAENVNKLTFESLTKMQDPNKRKYDQFIHLAQSANNFVDDQTGEVFGDCSQWGTDRAIVLDSLTGLSQMAMQLVVGGRPTRSMPDWMIAQNMVKGFLDMLTTSTRCWVVVISHLSRERNEITGGSELTVKTLGKALAPDIPLYMSDVVQAVRVGEDFYWDTAAANVATKARNLPISSKIPQDFGQIVASWKKAGGVFPSNPEAEA